MMVFLVLVLRPLLLDEPLSVRDPVLVEDAELVVDVGEELLSAFVEEGGGVVCGGGVEVC